MMSDEAGSQGEPEAVSVRTAAARMGINEDTAYRLIGRGEFPVPVVRVGRQWRVPLGPLNAFLHPPK